MNPKILVVGSIAFDVIFSVYNRFQDAISVHKGAIETFNASYVSKGKKMVPGGNAGNIAYWLGTQGIGSDVAVFSAYGRDFSQGSYGRKLERLGIEVRGPEGAYSGNAYMISDESNQQFIIWQPNAFEKIETVSLREFYSEAELKSFEYAIFSVMVPEAMQKHLEVFRTYNKTAQVIFDPGQVTPLFTAEKFNACNNLSDILVGNEVEFEHFEPFLGDLAASDSLVIRTEGEKGGTYFQGGKPQYFPSHPVEAVVEVTGAGDAFRSGFIAGSMRGASLVESIDLGAQLGAECVQILGPQKD